MLEKTKIINFCDKIILFSLYIVAFFLPISKAIIEIFSTLAIAGFIIKKIIQKEGITKTSFNLVILVYLAICFFSIFISSSLRISARTFFGKTLQEILFVFALVDTLNNERRIKRFIYIMFASSLLLGIDGIYQHFTHKDFIRHRPYYGLPRIHTTFSTPNDFGSYLVVIIPFVLIQFFLKPIFKFYRLLFFGLFLLLFTCLTFTVSRGAWLAFMSTMLFMSIWIRSLGIFFLALGIFIMITQQFCYPLLKERLNNFFIFRDPSTTDRKVIWQAAWNMFMYKPWIGVGLGTFMYNFSKFVTPGYLYGVPYAHNCYLQMACEIGIIGVSSFLFLIAMFFYKGIEILNTNSQQKTFFWYALLASLAAILGYCVQMAVDTNFYSLDLGLLFWLVLGLGIAAMKNIKEGVLN